jgi:hypothetical protein
MTKLGEAWKCDVPAGESGEWRVVKFTVSPDESKLDALRGMFGGSGRFTPPGEYTQLLRGRTLVMSDTPHQLTIMLNGLGLGCVARCLLEKEETEVVHIVEQSPDVIKLVAPHLLKQYGEERLQIFEGDAFTWKPPEKYRKGRYSAVWHDIWDDICLDNLSEMHKLHRRYGRWTNWQGSWSRMFLERQKRQERNRGGWY